MSCAGHLLDLHSKLGFTLIYVTHSKEEMRRIGTRTILLAGWKGGHSMKWITRERVKVIGVACPWLIKKFVDPDAEFLFLPYDTDWAGLREGTVYDVPDCELGHHERRSFVRRDP